MKIKTYSIIAGSEACNARCPYCVSGMTPNYDLGTKLPEVNWRNFDKGSQYAKDNGVSTVLITGKGEPTIFPEQITEYLRHLQPYNFPFIEIQTNGLFFEEKREEYQKHLKEWYDLGMTTIAVSIAHYDSEKNREIFQPHKEQGMNLDDLVENLHNHGFSVRLSATMLKGYIDSIEEVKGLIDYAREHNVEQLTIRPVEKPKKSRNSCITDYVTEHKLESEQVEEIKEYLDTNGTELMRLQHGAIIYDVEDQNICLANCLTTDSKSDELRQLIFFPDGHLRYDWQYQGAVLL